MTAGTARFLLVVGALLVGSCNFGQVEPAAIDATDYRDVGLPPDHPLFVDPGKVSFSRSRGRSCNDLVVIRGAETDFQGTGAELMWLAKQYPGFKKLGSGMGDCPDRVVDVVKIKTSSGPELEIMFDITASYGKM